MSLKVAGIAGEVWIVSGIYDGEKYKEEIVVTKNKKVVKIVRAMFNVFSSMSGAQIEENFYELQKGYVTTKADGLQLKSFSEKSIQSSEYELPKQSQKQKAPDSKKENSDNEDVSLDEAVKLFKLSLRTFSHLQTYQKSLSLYIPYIHVQLELAN